VTVKVAQGPFSGFSRVTHCEEWNLRVQGLGSPRRSGTSRVSRVLNRRPRSEQWVYRADDWSFETPCQPIGRNGAISVFHRRAKKGDRNYAVQRVEHQGITYLMLETRLNSLRNRTGQTADNPNSRNESVRYGRFSARGLTNDTKIAKRAKISRGCQGRL
jgi:hypothetical protein